MRIKRFNWLDSVIKTDEYEDANTHWFNCVWLTNFMHNPCRDGGRGLSGLRVPAQPSQRATPSATQPATACTEPVPAVIDAASAENVGDEDGPSNPEELLAALLEEAEDEAAVELGGDMDVFEGE